jgi:hypothetical protein
VGGTVDGTRPDAGTPPAVPTVAEVVRRVDGATPFVSVVTSSPGPTVRLDEVAAHVAAGSDPFAPWRGELNRRQEASAGRPVPPHVPAAFVLQWWCEVVATPLAGAVATGPWVLSPAPVAAGRETASVGLGFELAPALHPARVVVDADRWEVRPEPDRAHREAVARELYVEIASPVVAAFAPEVRMGSRQRWGVLHDTWGTAVRRAVGAAGGQVGPEPWRRSCCFVYLLPGAHECAACPRRQPPRGR